MVDLCDYKDIFGKPREGAHSYRILDIAVVDFLLTIVLAYITTLLFKRNGKNVNFFYSLAMWLVIATFLHWLFCVDSTFVRWLKLN